MPPASSNTFSATSTASSSARTYNRDHAWCMQSVHFSWRGCGPHTCVSASAYTRTISSVPDGLFERKKHTQVKNTVHHVLYFPQDSALAPDK